MRMTDKEKMGMHVLARRIDLGSRVDFPNNAIPIADLFNLSVGRVFLKDIRTRDARTGHPGPNSFETFEKLSFYWHSAVDDYVNRYGQSIIHVIDWLWSASVEYHAWLKDLDDEGRPKKLMKCGSMSRLLHEADKAERPLQRNPLPHFMTLTSADERHVIDLGAGYSLVRLLSLDAFDVEGAEMSHCIGRGSYDEYLLVGGHEFYSVRDEDAARRATLQIVPKLIDDRMYGQIRQFVGFANEPPEAHVAALVAGVMSDMMWIEKPRTKHEVATDDDLARAFVVGGRLR
ncbi:hypothetical protein IFT59_07245 [Rhizobium sp. CFBP 8752]|uniref:hypothetical protein n=1 Tax=Rhizobium sp. CFBP 8752 TaxID=2775301 RepID=UPI001786125A|nr:hypothetical protein [Rhizobium sp. CFBP 8752]MBD8663047.1 hypothetical protein [Rhizobium sp. CFBP 8752]